MSMQLMLIFVLCSSSARDYESYYIVKMLLQGGESTSGVQVGIFSPRPLTCQVRNMITCKEDGRDTSAYHLIKEVEARAQG